jgi:hypothetical protein
MSNMFNSCITFNKPLNKWNVFYVKDLTDIFNFCEKFDQNLCNWVALLNKSILSKDEYLKNQIQECI